MAAGRMAAQRMAQFAAEQKRRKAKIEIARKAEEKVRVAAADVEGQRVAASQKQPPKVETPRVVVPSVRSRDFSNLVRR